MLFACLTICTCTQKGSDSSTFSDTTSLNKKALVQTEIYTIKINATFPFGCADLAKYKYPHYWDDDREHYKKLKSPEGKELAEISILLQLKLKSSV